jgi:hypothetical protein
MRTTVGSRYAHWSQAAGAPVMRKTRQHTVIKIQESK